VQRRRQCHWADGRIYRGQWLHGKAHGEGVEVRPDGSIRHDGVWENDAPVRPNKHHRKNSGSGNKRSSSEKIVTAKDEADDVDADVTNTAAV